MPDAVDVIEDIELVLIPPREAENVSESDIAEFYYKIISLLFYNNGVY